MTKVFISYSSEDRDFAEKVCSYLEKNGKECWIAPRNIPAGAEYGAEIIKGIENSNAFVLIYSDSSNKSQHTLREVERAVNKKIPLISYKIENAELTKSMEYFLLTNQWIDSSAKRDSKLDELNTGIDKLTENGDIAVEATLYKPLPKKSGKKRAIIIGIIAVLAVAGCVTAALAINNQNKPADSANDSVQTTANTTEQSAAASLEAVTTTTAPDNTDVTEATTQAPLQTVSLNAGDFVSFGRYSPSDSDTGSDIKWTVLEADNENGTAVLISSEIIDIKPFDCAESGTFDKNSSGESYDRSKRDEYSAEEMMQFRGSNVWETSDIRAWLNAAGNVSYSSVSQADEATDEHGNGFSSQQGFLTGFSDNEKAALKLSTATNDLVYLLSVDEVNKYSELDFFKLHPQITAEAAANDETSWYNTYKDSGASDYIWATRSANEENGFEIYMVNSEIQSDTFSCKYAAGSGFGIRPVITVSLTGCTLSGDGSTASPYTFTFND